MDHVNTKVELIRKANYCLEGKNQEQANNIQKQIKTIMTVIVTIIYGQRAGRCRGRSA